MGITGLLPFLDKASEKINIKSLKNSSVAIDSYCWLHKGAFAVGDKLARGEETDVHIQYCLKYVNMLLSHNIKPILVFDGRHLPAKAETEAKRRESRKNAKQRAIELMRKGDHREAQNQLRRCVDITHEMALQLIKVCRALNVDCVVAPYEADAQLAYLNKIGLADYIISEDSDLTLFGCRKILFKLDLSGNCVLVNADKLHLAMDCPINKFTMDKFRLMCILSGCDYINSLPGIGLVKACKFVMKTEETDLMRALDKIPAYLNMRQLTVTEEYKINVLKARATFLHMVVFDPRRRKQVRLHEIEESDTDIDHCCNAGEILEGANALNLAVGNLNPFSMKKLDDWHPDQRERAKMPANFNARGLKVAKHPSMWHRDYRFTTLSNDTKPPTAATIPPPKPVIKKAMAPKRLMEANEESDEDKPTESQNDELVLNQYINEPSQKRFKEDIDDDDMEVEEPKEQITPNRNPFKKSVPCKEELLSPTSISQDNNSLVKNQSPVKRIDYGKLEKLSRFSRTVTPSNKQHVISRFFGASVKPKIENDIKPMAVTKSDSGIHMKSPNLLDSKPESPPAMLYNDKSSDSGFSPNAEESSQKTSQIESVDSEDDLSRESQRVILDKFKCALKDKMDACVDIPMEAGSSQETSNEIEVIPSDNENDIENSQNMSTSTNRTWLSSSQKSKPSTKVASKTSIRRKPSLSSLKSGNNSKTDSSQSRLSMFGFQKKAVMKH